MTNHPDRTALEAYVLGHHRDIDVETIESHIGDCDACLDDVGREARLELLLAAAGAEDMFASVLPARRRLWPLAAAAVAVAAAAIYLVWPSATIDEATTAQAPAAAPARAPAPPAPERVVRPQTARCSERSGDLICTAAAQGATYEDTEAVASDIAIEGLLERALRRGGPAIRAQRSVYSTARSAALRSGDREESQRRLHQVASRARLGRRVEVKHDELSMDCQLAGPACEAGRFYVFVRFVASAKEIDELLAGYRVGRIDGAELVRIIPSVRWALDPGDKMAWFVHRPGKLAELGVRAGDVLLHDQRRNANAMRVLVERDEVRIWRQGLERPVPPSKLR
jgi:hypothetical protein